MKNIILVMLFVFCAGCSTIHFDRGSSENVASFTTTVWHHSVVLAMVELSPPVILSEECVGREWSSVKTETTIADVFLSGLVNVTGVFWQPKTIVVSCS